MSDVNIPYNVLAGFQFEDEERLRRKIITLADSGHQGLHIVSDFDMTLTAGKMPGQNVGTWDVLDELLPPEGVEKHRQIYQSFRPIEIAGELTEDIAIEKWAETLDLMIEYGMNLKDIDDAFLSVAMLRDGVKELFSICEDFEIPTVVLSSGVKNVIECIVDRYDVRPDFIFSNQMIVDEWGQFISWDKQNLIHIMNKKERGHQELARLRDSRPHVILLGDVIDDIRMVDGPDVLRIRVIDPRKGENHHREDILRDSFAAGYDLVVDHSLQPAAQLVAWLSAPK